MDSELIKTLIAVAVVAFVVIVVVLGLVKGQKYMKTQKEEGTDRKRLMKAVADLFVVKDGEIRFRNLMPVNWEETSLKYRPSKKDIRVEFSIAGAAIPMFVPYVMKSSGIENSSEPLGFYQENEVERLLTYLPGYPAKK